MWRPNTAKNPTKICPKALAIFATCSWPSLCEQSELQCWRRNRRLYGPAQISAARAASLQGAPREHRRRSAAKHCSSLCSQSEGGRIVWRPNTAKNPTKICPKALAIFATCSWPSLCKQSELQCSRRNRRLCWPAQISAARALLPLKGAHIPG